jgi:hypothetical protein
MDMTSAVRIYDQYCEGKRGVISIMATITEATEEPEATEATRSIRTTQAAGPTRTAEDLPTATVQVPEKTITVTASNAKRQLSTSWIFLVGLLQYFI